MDWQTDVRPTSGLDATTISTFVAPRDDAPGSARPLHGGLEAAAVARVSVRWMEPSRRTTSTSFVAKRLASGRQCSALFVTHPDARRC